MGEEEKNERKRFNRKNHSNQIRSKSKKMNKRQILDSAAFHELRPLCGSAFCSMEPTAMLRSMGECEKKSK